MKTLAALILTALLAACGDYPPEVAPLPPAQVATATPAPVVEPEAIVTPEPITVAPVVSVPVVTPVPTVPPVITPPDPITYCGNLQVQCLDTCPWYLPCELLVCPETELCTPAATRIQSVRPVIPLNNPKCTTNAKPLVYLAPYWVDNCGNFYKKQQ